MSLYDSNKKLLKPTENIPAMEAAAKVAEQWRKEHAGDLSVSDAGASEPQYDERGRQINSLDRTEELVIEAATFTVRKYSDGTIRTDSRLPPAPPKPAVTAQTEMRYTAEDMAQLRSEEGKMKVQVTPAGGMRVSGPAVELPSRPSRGPWEPQRPYVPRSE